MGPAAKLSSCVLGKAAALSGRPRRKGQKRTQTGREDNREKTHIHGSYFCFFIFHGQELKSAFLGTYPGVTMVLLAPNVSAQNSKVTNVTYRRLQFTPILKPRLLPPRWVDCGVESRQARAGRVTATFLPPAAASAGSRTQELSHQGQEPALTRRCRRQSLLGDASVTA